MVQNSDQNLREAASRGKYGSSPHPYLPPAELEKFFRKCDLRHGSDTEPELDWEEHLAVMEKSRGWETSGR